MDKIKKLEQEIVEQEKQLQQLKRNKQVLESLTIIEECSYRWRRYDTRDVTIQGTGDNEFQAQSLKLSFHDDLPRELIDDFRNLIKKWKEIIEKDMEETEERGEHMNKFEIGTTMFKVVCPSCGFFWWANLEKASGTAAMHRCSYCHRDYNIISNIRKQREY